LSRAWVAAVVACAAASLALPVFATSASPHGLTVIGPGRETDVLRLVAPYVDGGPVGESVRLAGVRVDPRALTFEVGSTGATARLVLRPLDGERGRGRPLDASRSFDMSVEPGETEPLLARAVEALAARVRVNDDGTFFASAARTSEAALGTAVSATAVATRTWAAYAGWLALLGLLMWAARGPWRRGPGLRALATLVLALAVRLLQPETVLHSNSHYIEELRSLVGGDAGTEALARRTVLYGASWLAPQRLLALVAGGTDAAVFLTSALWGAIAAGLTAIAAETAFASAAVGLCAGSLMALLPVASRLAHSESEFVVAQVIVALGLLFAARAGRSGRARDLAGLALALGLLGTGHTLAPAFSGALLLAVAALAWDCGRPFAANARRLLPLVLVPLACGGLFVALQGPFIAARIAETPATVPVPSRPWEFWLWLDPHLSPHVFAALVPLGLAVLCTLRFSLKISRLLASFGLAAGLLLFIASTLLVTGSVADGLRYQALPAPLLCLLAAGALSLPAVGPRLPARVWQALGGLVLASIVGWGLLSPAAWTWRDVEAQSFALLVEALRDAPDGTTLVIPDRHIAGGARVEVDVPEFLGRRYGRRFERVELSEALRLRALGRLPVDRTLVWRGPFCQAVPFGSDEALQDGLRPECAALLAALAGDPYVEAELGLPDRNPDGLEPSFLKIEGVSLLIGLYRVSNDPDPS